MAADLIAWLYNTISAGVVGGVAANATYEAIKFYLGKSFGKLENSVREDNRAKFNDLIELALEQNEKLQQQLEELKSGKPANHQSITGSISTGNITSTNGSVHVGHSINK
ncbi:hypothetical protein [Thiofilum flexile]|uniref:hypothetical protein n=1 Tax=Thiofilum flexile TaxID=125627 RepID=UPI000377C2B5|nr:hypothetical protein [Thiofilum flexile]